MSQQFPLVNGLSYGVSKPMALVTSSETFQIEHDGKTYDCRRDVSGDRIKQQTIYVSGIGSKDDVASYGGGYHRIESMLGTAKLIAHEIVRENGKSSP